MMIAIKRKTKDKTRNFIKYIPRKSNFMCLFLNRFLEFMKNWTTTSKPDYMDVAYFSERSVEDELDRESHSDVLTIIISYLVMFLYIVFTLGPSNILLSFFGIVLIVASVVCSIGFYGLIGVPLSFIVLEVTSRNSSITHKILFVAIYFQIQCPCKHRLYHSLCLPSEWTIYF